MAHRSDIAAPRDATRRVATLALGRIASRVVSSAALGICLLLVARGTLVSEFGQFMVVYTVGLVVGLLAGVGAPVRVLRASAEAPAVVGALYLVHTCLTVTAFIALGAVFSVIGWSWIVLAGVLFAVGDTVQNYAQGYLTSQDRQVAANALVISHRLVPLAAAAGSLFATGEVSYPLLACSFAVPAVLGVMVPARSASRAALARWREVFTGGVSYWIYAGSAVITQLQIPAVGAVAAPATVGAFSMATRVVGPITLLTASMSAVLVPELAKRLGDRAAFAHLYRTSVRVSAAYLVVVIVLAWPGALVVTALAGPQYRDATLLVFAMIIGAGISAFAQGFNSKLLAIGRAGASATAIVAGGLIGLAMIVAIGVGDAESSMLWTVPVVSQAITLILLAIPASREPTTDLEPAAPIGDKR